MTVKKRHIKRHMISNSIIKNPTMILFRINSKESHKGELSAANCGKGRKNKDAGYDSNSGRRVEKIRLQGTAAARYSGSGKEKTIGKRQQDTATRQDAVARQGGKG
ncbi:unnamed protein product [Prunus armeniaca]|uniref:Uncharacterized protein n=1 Tax=Prunus armeniaca TaxID=36596 RepID=A0A6J5TIE4_PRUAR|nr:unnamed protein product [Prunus armeniaca]